MRAGVIGLGDMGSGLAKNLIANGFQTTGRDLLDQRMQAFGDMGGKTAESAAEVGAAADAVFVMVMKGCEAKEVILGADGLVQTMAPGGAVILSATVHPSEAREIGAALGGTGLHLIDTPVSGGYPGAQAGTLTMMAAAPDEVLDRFAPVMHAVSASIHRVGTEPGQGQTVKAVLQSLLGAMFSATFEAASLAAKAGIPGQVIYDVVSTSSGGCGITSNALEKIIDRQFEGTGSHINTMHKDLTISMALGQELGVPLHTAAAAMQIFHAGRTKYPNGDNWVCTRVMEEIVGAELHR
ncbi:NAD(P)-dependent oxidoreductase [Aestuariicoccus sp. MJ-SS9]|uniref:NAD(P)-dependent oxidoreductase n=1 Tax=Aestuariicoccus sp. MJ-SS9 TaxID=3079855 RepID=UPI00290B0085|nr:NAD(P)-dependent oxidoreductase [Aestuariicoccus sp. MJ-SS9]MDU8910321.1 NAD(P)-dependent oxidoreductase [Aestuariicoccus sp. MJ-SS9]